MEQELKRLTDIMAQLRGEKGCPWDREQDHESILKCLIEEAYEFYDAVLEKNDAKMCEELGDLMLQVVFHAQMAAERKAFDMTGVLRAISDKLVRRHPHVFGTAEVDSSDQVVTNWEKIKQSEENNRSNTSILDGIPAHMPALLKAHKLQKKAARMGFDWDSLGPVLDKVSEEIAELKREIEKKNASGVEAEMGDVLFSLVNLARHIKADPELALSRTNRKFEARFRRMERKIRDQGRALEDLSLSEMDVYWEQEKLQSPSY